jgi:hypothetical protein
METSGMDQTGNNFLNVLNNSIIELVSIKVRIQKKQNSFIRKDNKKNKKKIIEFF